MTQQVTQSLRKLWNFHGGLKLSGHKGLSNHAPIRTCPVSRELYIPLSQHIGHAAEPEVKVGDKVLKGQLIGHAEGPISAPVHASSSGTVTAIEERAIPHPSGLPALCVVIETDGYDQWQECTPLIASQGDNPPSIDEIGVEQLTEKISQAGVVGLGGALYPSSAKLNTARKKHVDTLIINAAECEPYITCDDVLMRSRPEEIILGIRLIQKFVAAKTCLIGIEDNKPEAYEALKRCIQGYDKTNGTRLDIVQVPTLYPAGGEKQLIQVLTGKEVPSQQLPMDIGIICHNITTAAAVYHAVYRGEPLISRIVTVTGGAVKKPQNIEVPLGTPIRDVLELAELDTEKVDKIIMGGPMMGFALPTIDAPVTKATNCLLITEKNELSTPPPAMPCIRCGRCAESCPMSLLPQQMYWYAKARDLEKVQDYNIFDCIECGCCSYECPSNIPLVQYFRYAKNEIWNDERERNKANIARERHEFREERLEKARLAKEEAARLRKEKLAKKKAAEKAAKANKKDDDNEAPSDSKEDAAAKTPSNADLIQQAVARSKAKKAKQQAQKRNTENLTDAQQKQIDEANERRRKTQEATDSNNSTMKE
jgi:electron transport complex protein RnfC